jgi:hypothetical protein
MFDVVLSTRAWKRQESNDRSISDLCFGGELSGDNFVFKDTLSAVYADTDFKAWRLESRKASKNQEISVGFAQYSGTDSWKKRYRQYQKQNEQP